VNFKCAAGIIQNHCKTETVFVATLFRSGRGGGKERRKDLGKYEKGKRENTRLRLAGRCTPRKNKKSKNFRKNEVEKKNNEKVSEVWTVESTQVLP
jgi:hypothetical protein